MIKSQNHQVIRPIGKPLTEEEKKQKIMQFVQQKREAFAINILCSLIQGDFENSNEDLVERSVTLADKLFEALYPLPEEKKEK